MIINILTTWDDSTFHDHHKAAQDAGQMATKSPMAHIAVATPWQKNLLISNKIKLLISNFTST